MMADVFLSYASEDRGRVEPLADALEAAGFSVWWDRRIEPGSSFDREIEKELSSASCVVVVWSQLSVSSNWVREEADEGLLRGILVPVQIDECQLPLGFRRTQAADLIGWPSQKRDLSSLVQKITGIIGERLTSPDIANAHQPGQHRTGANHPRWIYATVATLLVASLIWAAWTHFRVDVLAQLALAAPRYFGNPLEQRLANTITSDGVQIAYATTGSGPPLMIVVGWETHLEKGIMSPLYDGANFLSDFSERFTVVRYDGRGTGLSQRSVNDFSLLARVRDIEAVADDLALDRFSIFAASAGANAAMQYTARHPDRVEKLVIAAGWVPNWSDPSIPAQSWNGVPELYRASWDTVWVREMAAARLEPGMDEVEKRVVSELLKISAEGNAMAGILEEALEEDPSNLLRDIAVPTLVINGERDNIVPVQWGQRLAANIPGARFELLSGAGHSGTVSADLRMRSLVVGFLRN
jgi:pimeloyl-ACP methyl ester carboxylesterase